MKKSTVLNIIKQKLRKYNSGHYSYDETKHAEEILKVLEETNLIKPMHKKTIYRKDIECMSYEDTVIVEGWEKEGDEWEV